jgi:DNA-binding NtrC family response regulator
MNISTPSILVVEDEAELREAVIEVMKDVTPNVLGAEDGVEALKVFSINQVALVVSDINMPNMTGLQLLREIRSKGSDVPFIFITAHSQKNYIVEAFRLGATDFIEKPFDINQLLKMCSSAYELGLAILDAEQEIERLFKDNPSSLEKIKKLKNCTKKIRLMEIENNMNEQKKAKL